MKKIIASFAALSLLAFVAFPAIGATTADVTSTVTAQLISVSVSDGSVSYGTLGIGTTRDTTASEANDTQSATNNGNVEVDLGIRSGDATSAGTEWNLAASADTDEFTHRFSTNSGGSWTAFDVVNANYSTLANNIATSTSQTFDLEIGTPDVSTDSVEHSVIVTVQATAS